MNTHSFSKPHLSLIFSLLYTTIIFVCVCVCFSEEALIKIAKTMGKTNWRFSVDPCDDSDPAFYKSNWVHPKPVDDMSINAVKCNCTIANDGFCHVVNMQVSLLSSVSKIIACLVGLSPLNKFIIFINKSPNKLRTTHSDYLVGYFSHRLICGY